MTTPFGVVTNSRPSPSQSIENGSPSTRVITSPLPSASNANTSPAIQSHIQNRPSCHRGDSPMCSPVAKSSVIAVETPTSTETHRRPTAKLLNTGRRRRETGAPKEEDEMGSDADLVRRLTNEVFLDGNVAAIDELVADDFTTHDPPPGLPATKDGMRELASMVIAAFSDRVTDFDDMLDTAAGRVIENWAMLAKHTGDAFGVPPSGQDVRVRGVEIWRCADGKIVEHWGAVDMSDVFMKAGPPPG